MKRNRNMFYSNNQTGGFFNPNVPNMMPSGFNQNNNYMAYGPNAVPNAMPNQYGYPYNDESILEERVEALETEVRRLSSRISALESNTTIIETNSNDAYII